MRLRLRNRHKSASYKTFTTENAISLTTHLAPAAAPPRSPRPSSSRCRPRASSSSVARRGRQHRRVVRAVRGRLASVRSRPSGLRGRLRMRRPLLPSTCCGTRCRCSAGRQVPFRCHGRNASLACMQSLLPGRLSARGCEGSSWRPRRPLRCLLFSAAPCRCSCLGLGGLLSRPAASSRRAWRCMLGRPGRGSCR